MLAMVIDHRQEKLLRGGLGQVFEPIVHLRMKEQGLGPSVVDDMVDQKNQFIVKFPSEAMKVTVIKVKEDISKLNAGDYGEPDKSNFACIDAILRLKDGTFVLIQITLGDEHPFKGLRLLELLDLLPQQREYPLIFVTVEGNNKLFRAQKYQQSGSEQAMEPTGKLRQVHQYVYHFPLVPPDVNADGSALPVLSSPPNPPPDRRVVARHATSSQTTSDDDDDFVSPAPIKYTNR